MHSAWIDRKQKTVPRALLLIQLFNELLSDLQDMFDMLLVPRASVPKARMKIPQQHLLRSGRMAVRLQTDSAPLLKFSTFLKVVFQCSHQRQ